MNILISEIDRLRVRFHIGQCCMVADRGMVSAKTLRELEKRQIPYIFGARMRKVNEIKCDVLSRPGRYRDVHPERTFSKDPAPLKVKEVSLNGSRSIVCLNPRQARKDAQDRQAITECLKKKIRTNPKGLIGNRGYRKYLKIKRDTLSIHHAKIDYESRFDGKWLLTTNTHFSAAQVALKYKELWQVEHVFRDIKSVLETIPVFHQRDEKPCVL